MIYYSKPVVNINFVYDSYVVEFMYCHALCTYGAVMVELTTSSCEKCCVDCEPN